MQRQITKRAAAVQHLRLRRIYSGFYVSSFQGSGAFLIDVRPAIHLQEESETLHRSPYSPKESVAGRGNWSAEIILFVPILAPLAPIVPRRDWARHRFRYKGTYLCSMICRYARCSRRAYFLISHSENDFIPNSPENNPSSSNRI